MPKQKSQEPYITEGGALVTSVAKRSKTSGKEREVSGCEGFVTSNSIGKARSFSGSAPLENGRPIRVRQVYSISEGPPSDITGSNSDGLEDHRQ